MKISQKKTAINMHHLIPLMEYNKKIDRQGSQRIAFSLKSYLTKTSDVKYGLF